MNGDLWKERIDKVANAICNVIKIVLTVMLWLCGITIYYGAKILHLIARFIFKQFEKVVQRDSDRIQERLRRNNAKAISAIGNGIDQKIERGQCINKRKAKQGEPVSLRYIN